MILDRRGYANYRDSELKSAVRALRQHTRLKNHKIGRAINTNYRDSELKSAVRALRQHTRLKNHKIGRAINMSCNQVSNVLSRFQGDKEPFCS
jgi:hypothetical protein